MARCQGAQFVGEILSTIKVIGGSKIFARAITHKNAGKDNNKPSKHTTSHMHKPTTLLTMNPHILAYDNAYVVTIFV